MEKNLTNIGAFSSIPHCNSKFDSFFKSKTAFASGARYAYEYVTDMNTTAKNEHYPHEIFYGEDTVTLTSRDGLLQFRSKLDNKGVGREVFFTATDHEHKIDLKTFEFGISDTSETDEFSVSYRQTNAYPKKGEKGQFQVTLGVENYNAQGFVSGLKSVVLTDSATNEVLKAQSIFEYADSEGRICSETLTLRDGFENLTAEPGQILQYRLDMLDQVPTSSYAVNGQRANGDQIIDIMATAQASMQADVAAMMGEAQTN
ncbi:MAG: hypothetical protein IJW32_04085 [Clostridia bacterium]|nr:hypothetical protein [Clostridia bacterium]